MTANSNDLYKDHGHVLGTGPSAPNAFQSALFDYQFAKFLGLAPYSGSEIGECFATAHKIRDGDEEGWTREWLALAQRIEKIAQESLDRGHRISAREAFLRATTYYQASFYFLLDHDSRKRQYHGLHVRAFEKAGALFDPPFEAVSIPYDGRALVGWYLRADKSSIPRPTVIIQMGADGTAIQCYFSGGGAAGLRRGYNVLLFEGPGQTSSFYKDRSVTYRYDWEVPIGAAVDYLLKRSEVDPNKIALIAYSLGGYFGPRAAAFEKRLAALVVSSLIPDPHELLFKAYGFDKLLEQDLTKPVELTPRQIYGLQEHMPKHGFNDGVKSLPAWSKAMKKYNLWDLADKITLPLLNLTGTGEGERVVQESREFFDKLSNPKNKFVLTTAEDGAEMHCQKGNASLLHQIEFDWLDEVLEL